MCTPNIITRISLPFVLLHAFIRLFSLSLLSETPKQNSFLQFFSTISPTTFPSLFLLVIPTLFCLFISNTLLCILSPNTIIIYQSFNNLHCAIITLIKAWEKVTSFNQMVHSKSLFFRPPQTLLKHLLGKQQKVIFLFIGNSWCKELNKVSRFFTRLLWGKKERRKERKKEGKI